MAGSSNMLGYSETSVINFRWMLYNRNFRSEVPPSHILNCASIGGVTNVSDIINDILAQETGATNPNVTSDTLKSTSLVAALHSLVRSWNPGVIRQLCYGYCTPSTEEVSSDRLSLKSCSIDKCCYQVEDVYEPLCRSSVLGSEGSIEISQDMGGFCRVKKRKCCSDGDICLDCQQEVHKVSGGISEMPLMQLDDLAGRTVKKRRLNPCDSSDTSQSDVIGDSYHFTDNLASKSALKQCTTLQRSLLYVEKQLILQEISYCAPKEEQHIVNHLKRDLLHSKSNCTTENIFNCNLSYVHDFTASNLVLDRMPPLGLSCESCQPTTSSQPLPFSARPIPIARLLAFVRVLLKRFVPLELVGSPRNLKQLMRGSKLVLLAGVIDKIPLSWLIVGVKVEQCKWAKILGSHLDATFAVAKVFLWLLQRVVLAVVHAFFYITECGQYKYLKIYYMKDVFCRLSDLALNCLVKNGSLRCLQSCQSTCDDANNNGTVGALKSKLRFIPKSSGMRPIYPIKSAGANSFTVQKMRMLLGLMIKRYDRGYFGLKTRSRLQGMWKDFNRRLREANKETQHLYIVKVDVTDAFGSILHPLLIDIIKCERKNWPSVIEFGVYSTMKKNGRPNMACHYILFDRDGRPTEALYRDGLPMIETNVPIHINVDIIMRMILTYIEHQFVSAGICRKYMVTKGIAQGGTISTELCELYYSVFCDKYWKCCAGPSDLLMRSVDDFLYVSASKASAERFLALSSLGNEEFNCFINVSKTVHNVTHTPTFIRVPFCGVTVCSATRQLLVSAPHILSFPPRYSMKLNPGANLEDFVVTRLKQVSLARLNDMVIDPSYTTVSGLVANVFRVGIMSGARLEALYNTVLRFKKGARPDRRFIEKSVDKVANALFKRIEKVWRLEDKPEPAVCKEVLMVAYIDGVRSMLGLKHHINLPGAGSNLRRLSRRYRDGVPLHMLCILPPLVPGQ